MLRRPVCMMKAPAAKNSSVFITAWFMTCSRLASVASAVPMPSTATISPIWASVEKASIRLISVSKSARISP